jgi:lipoyl(octanoyl) transferase
MFKNKFNFSPFGLTEDHQHYLDERTLVIRKWNWDYSQAYEFQKHCVHMLDETPRLRILICCNHPKVLTNGRGLQRPRKGETLELKAFNPQDFQNLPFPLHQIERGGGLTFHHPGQFIFYPILKLNPKALSLSKMTDDIFEFTAQVLTNWGIQNISHTHKLMGLWHGDKKLASMGIAIKKLTTFHGLALNVFNDEEMKLALTKMNPCGLSSSIYIAAEELTSLPFNAIDSFADDFLKKVSNGWQ